jgi:cytoskeletal protein CcmA (bactofilin family)
MSATGGSTETRTRVVVEGQWDGSVIPGRVEEMLRQVIVKPGAVVTGCVFGSQIRVEGPSEIRQAVYSSGDLELVPSGDIRFRSAVGAREVVAVMSDGPGRVVVQGDLTGKRVSLHNALVRGSVYGDEVRLQRSLVLGAVHASRLAEIEQSTLLTAEAPELRFREGCALILPYARAGKVLDVQAPVTLVALPAEGNLLTEGDVVHRGGLFHLTAGRRLTHLSLVAGALENVSNFLVRYTLGEGLRAEPQALPVSVERLPETFRGALVETN